MPSRNVVVSGRVQGVGFRWFVKDLADRYAITGEVWNRRDGCVEASASHPDETVLDQWEAALSQGPGRVDAVTSNPAPDDPPITFEIGPTR